MSGAQFTKGPWEADRTCVRNCGEQHRFTCGLTRTAYATQDEMRANARLIAAAPELYEAAQRILHTLEGQTLGIRSEAMNGFAIALSELHAALRKARGETA